MSLERGTKNLTETFQDSQTRLRQGRKRMRPLLKEIPFCIRASLVVQLVKNLPAMLVTWFDPWGLGRSPGGGHGNPLQYSCLENPHGQRWATPRRASFRAMGPVYVHRPHT